MALPNDEANHDDDPSWYVKYTPATVNEVAVHKKKLADVEASLRAMLQAHPSFKILLLTGPSGCSKSTVAKLLASELVPQYRSHTVSLMQRTNKRNNKTLENGSEYFTEYNSTDSTILPLMSFDHFLNNATYLTGPNLNVVFVEDLPNVSYDGIRSRFQLSLKKWLNDYTKNLPPLVISLTECEIPKFLEEEKNFATTFSIDHKFIAETVFGNDILEHPKVKRIKFNPVNKTLIKRTLNGIARNEKQILLRNSKWGKPTTKIIDHISTGCGDVRSAIASFQLWSETGSSITGQEVTLKQETLSYFHAIGKIVYGSKESSHIEDVVQSIQDKYLMIHDPVMKLGVFENFHVNKGVSLPKATEVLEALSVSDLISGLKENTEYYLRATRCALKTEKEAPSSMKESVMKFPRVFKQRKKLREYSAAMDDFARLSLLKYQQVYSKKNIDQYYGFYSPLIKKKLEFKRKTLEAYNKVAKTPIPCPSALALIDPSTDYMERLGGEISGIQADTSLTEQNHSVFRQSKATEYAKIMASCSNLESLNDAGEGSDFSIEDDSDYEQEAFSRQDADDKDLFLAGDEDEDESLLQMLSQYQSQKSHSQKQEIVQSNSDLDDSDLEMLINK
ncbi:hypothetical protein ACO0QE_002807 [Hanseniaspora vineae]